MSDHQFELCVVKHEMTMARVPHNAFYQRDPAKGNTCRLASGELGARCSIAFTAAPEVEGMVLVTADNGGEQYEPSGWVSVGYAADLMVRLIEKGFVVLYLSGSTMKAVDE